MTHRDSFQTATALRTRIASGERSAVEVLEQCLESIGEWNDKLNAFLQVDEPGAREQAKSVDRMIAAGESPGMLCGVPIAVKDNICTTRMNSTCGSKMLEHYRSPYDATVVSRLLKAGAVIVGKTNLDEFAMGSSNENSAFSPVRNPWNLNCVPGGSSGGSAAAVASGMVPLAIGSDTGGSIRQPAAFCGITGVKPSYGRVSRYGLVAFGSSLDQIGPLCRDVRDAALVLNVLAGRDSRDTTCADIPVPDYTEDLDAPLGGLKIGIVQEMLSEGLDPEIHEAVEAAVGVYQQMGATLVDVHLPHLKYVIPCYYLVSTSEASSNLARFDGVHYGARVETASNIIDMTSMSRNRGFGSEVKRRIMLGTYSLSSGYYDAYYLKALKVRSLLCQDFESAFREADVLLSPTVPVLPFEMGERIDDPLSMYLVDLYTAPANLVGCAAISIPCGFSSSGLPIGMQLQAAPFEEGKLLMAAMQYERETQWHKRLPSVIS